MDDKSETTREISTIPGEEWATLAAGTKLRATASKAADFRHIFANQGITSSDAVGNLTLIFLRNEPGHLVQQFTFKGLHPEKGAELENQSTEVGASTVQACHVAMPARDAAVFAAQLLGLLKRTHPSLFAEVAPMTGITEQNA